MEKVNEAELRRLGEGVKSDNETCGRFPKLAPVVSEYLSLLCDFFFLPPRHMGKDGGYHSAAFAGILLDPCSDFVGDCREQRLLGERSILRFNSSL